MIVIEITSGACGFLQWARPHIYIYINTDRYSTKHVFPVNITDVMVFIWNIVFLCNIISVGGPNLCGVNCVH